MVRSGAMSVREFHECHECKARLESRNQLFKHMREAHGHPDAKPVDVDAEARRKAAKLEAKWAKRRKLDATIQPPAAPQPAPAPVTSQVVAPAPAPSTTAMACGGQCERNPLCIQRGARHSGECVLRAVGAVSSKAQKKQAKKENAARKHTVFAPPQEEIEETGSEAKGKQHDDDDGAVEEEGNDQENLRVSLSEEERAARREAKRAARKESKRRTA
mmetsp:Transcript_7131/g.18443  ORF Transcript_7131/g.18443 Transcript_7131/m.18443 type:complete len:217 (+) Transcript_7131:27-677(+)|eukprot:2572116-Prymnesium_polylepis.1